MGGHPCWSHQLDMSGALQTSSWSSPVWCATRLEAWATNTDQIASKSHLMGCVWSCDFNNPCTYIWYFTKPVCGWTTLPIISPRYWLDRSESTSFNFSCMAVWWKHEVLDMNMPPPSSLRFDQFFSQLSQQSPQADLIIGLGMCICYMKFPQHSLYVFIDNLISFRPYGSLPTWSTGNTVFLVDPLCVSCMAIPLFCVLAPLLRIQW